MARFVSLLVFLGLSLCCCRSQGQGSKMSVRLRSGGSPLALGARVELECVFSGHGLSDSGVSWMLQRRDSAPQFILFITSLNRVAPTENGKPPERFEAKKESNIYRLTVKSFQEQDQGSYYCIVNHNQRLHFSSGSPLHLPAPPTTAPSTKATTPQPSTTAGTKEPRDCKHSPNTAKAPKKGLDLSCDFYIWVPLASACLLLLIALLATIIMCQKTRRRRCKCKRPMNGSNGKPSMPNRYV
ncbi:T-cell surface glycoprotein CD8 alpha chain-like [Mauremys reevesii]|uniref:T-cell surface glycoprotein CD8 alpha chain-like n=1 Tax=Mauremys reevesii TaxID=260615 RepID=UPI00193F934A|nr:T-cell surface glycoprotein CD8 alpha chain-like [Mauremys reevesii]